MKLDTVCPDFHDLERLLLGQVSEEELPGLENHLAECSVCAERMSQLRKTSTPMPAFPAQICVETDSVNAVSDCSSALSDESELDAAESVDLTEETATRAACWR